jgi:hypothetical protein
MELSCLTLSLVIDNGPQSQWSPLATRTIEREVSLPADHRDNAAVTQQDVVDSALSRVGYGTEYFVVLATQGLRNLSPCHRNILIALSKVRRSPSKVWLSLSKFAHMERDRLLTPVVVT